MLEYPNMCKGLGSISEPPWMYKQNQLRKMVSMARVLSLSTPEAETGRLLCKKFKASLGYRVSFRPVCGMV